MSSVAPPADEEPTSTHLVPSLLTTSAKAVIEQFGSQIRTLRAHGSVETTNSRRIDEFREYGLEENQETTHRIAINYERIPGRGDEIKNPLDEDITDELFKQVHTHLRTEAQTVDPDLTVTSVTIRVDEPRLREVTPAQTEQFDLTFVADPAEDAVRDLTKQRNADRGLFTDLGFNIQNLNLRTVEEVAAKHHKQSDGRYFAWQGPDNVRPRAPTRLATRINAEILPDDYGILKPYVAVDNHALDIDEEQLSAVLSDASGGDL